MRVVEDIRSSMFALMQADPHLTVIGEDILDPYGGAFKVTQGLSDAFPDRVLTMPISESSIVGIGMGMAMRGRPVIAEIMFGDFLTLTLDQLLNHASKANWMFNGAVDIPLVVRTPMGGGRGYGPTHSQSIEKHFCGIPGLTVMAVHQYASPGALLKKAAALRAPVLMIENKIAYSKLVEPDRLPQPENPDLVILTYGGVTEMCVAAAKTLLDDEELAVKVVPIEQLSPLPEAEILAAVAGCDRVIAIEEGTVGWGFAAACAETLLKSSQRPTHFATLAAPAIPIPSARPWEVDILPNVDRIKNLVLEQF